MRELNRQSGFTLLSLPIVMAIIGGMATITLANVKGVMKEARDAKRAADAYQVTLALGLYYDDHLIYPVYNGSNQEKSLEILAKALVPEYMQELPVDPLDEDGYFYKYSGGRDKAVFIF